MNITFVCTGNTCRSPMAAAIFSKRMLEAGRSDIQCRSAGLGAAEGQPVSANAVEACKEIGVDIQGHTAHRLRGIDMVNTHLFVVMEEIHQKILVEAGMAKGQVYLLDNGIPDPYGKDLEAFRECRDAIQNAFADLEQFVFHDATDVFEKLKK